MNNKGFSLIEIIVAISISALFITAAAGFLSYGFNLRDIFFEQLSTQNEGRKLTQNFINELRRAESSDIGGYALEKAGEQELIFYSNVDGGSDRERVRYFLSGNTLKKGINKSGGAPQSYISSTEIIVDAVHDIHSPTATLFYYYDESYAGSDTAVPLAQPVDATAVRVVEFRLTLEENPRLSPAPLSLSAKAMMRNFKSN